MIIPCGVRMHYLNPVRTHKPGEIFQILDVICAAQLHGPFPGKKRQFGPQSRTGNCCCIDFVPEIGERVREVCQVSFAAAERSHGAYLQNSHQPAVYSDRDPKSNYPE